MAASEGAFRNLYADAVEILNNSTALAPLSNDLPKIPEWLGATPVYLPIIEKLTRLPQQASGRSRNLVDQIVQLAPDIPWQQTYVEEQVGKHYLQNYGWFNLLSPEGMFYSETIRISIGVWLKPIFYLEHSHEPEEDYLILAGGGLFRSEGCAPRQCGVGDTVHHTSNQRHSIDMADSDMVALAFWRGKNLMRRATLKTS
ncbi:MAG: dimethylsulfonioproprionate lyase family protein [Alphaproteobacteria bacterium]|nr:dimethylsulfonioproprionate lyase family protein [Alphaproteobacteria bacterium]